MKCPFALVMVLGLVGVCQGSASEARDAAAAIRHIEALGGTIQYDAKKNVVGVDLLGGQTTDADVELLAAFQDLRELALAGAEITDAGVKRLDAFPKLTALALENTEVTDAGLAVLKKLPQLILQR